MTRLGPNAKLRDAGIAYVLQDSSVFPDMTVERNLWLGGYLLGDRAGARQAAELLSNPTVGRLFLGGCAQRTADPVLRRAFAR